MPAAPQFQQVLGGSGEGCVTACGHQSSSHKPPEVILILHLAGHRFHQEAPEPVKPLPPLRKQLPLHPLSQAPVLENAPS